MRIPLTAVLALAAASCGAPPRNEAANQAPANAVSDR